MSVNLEEKTTLEDDYEKEKDEVNSDNQDKDSSLNQSSEHNNQEEQEEENNIIKSRLRKNPKKTVLPYSSEDLNKFEKKKKQIQTDLKDDDFKLFKNIVEKMKSNPKSLYFRYAAVRQFENKRDKDIYKSVIEHPMDLSHVIKKINNQRYATYQEFYDDLILIWENAQLFNQSGSTIYDDAEFMKNLTEKIFKEKKIDDKVIHKNKEVKDEELDAKFTENFIENINKIDFNNYQNGTWDTEGDVNNKNYVGKKRANNNNEESDENSDDEIEVAPIIDIKNSDDEKNEIKNPEIKNKKNIKTTYLTNINQFKKSGSNRNSKNDEKKLENILQKLKLQNEKNPEENKNNDNNNNISFEQNIYNNININKIKFGNNSNKEEKMKKEEDYKMSEELIKSYSYKIAKRLDRLTDEDMFDLIEFIGTIRPEAIDDTGDLLNIDMTKFEGDTYINVLNFVENAILNNAL